MKAVDFYQKYLGKDISKQLPATGIEFPLILRLDGKDVARAVVFKHSDKSLSFAGDVPENSLVKIGVGNAEIILNEDKI